MKVELAEIQGLIGSGYADRPAAAYAMFAVEDPHKVRAWLRVLIDRIQFSDFLRTSRAEPPFLKAIPLNLAFTHAGLRQLGLTEFSLSGFSDSFREGMAAPHRARQLGDDGPSAPEHWAWGGPGKPEIHGMLCAFSGEADGHDKDDAALDALLRSELSAEHGLSLVHLLPAHRAQKRERRKEHFGFRDGVSNPNIEGFGKAGRDTLKTGEVVLGYPNVYDKLALTPRVTSCDDRAKQLPLAQGEASLSDFGKHGSYLVFRQLKQDVPKFWRFAHEAAKPLGKDGVWLASRMVGRWPDGSPVTLFPERESPAAESDLNDFLFSEHEDAFGQRCPIGSHIRRTHPRDTMLPVPHDSALSGDAFDEKARDKRMAHTNVHRIVRRGRTYGPPLDPVLDPSKMLEPDQHERGLLFLCFNANLRRQFEFVQSSWIVNPNFAGLSDDPDPILASQRKVPFPASNFTLQGCPAQRITDLPRVVETVGGAYFFMPSRAALLFLSELEAPCFESGVPGESEHSQELAALHADKVKRDLEAQSGPKLARRGFHGKAHGIVRASFEVDAGLSDAFRAGVFQPGAKYAAWVRLSSGSFRVQSDETRDVRGIAIKLLGVPNEARAASFEQHTQDFLLIDAPFLMVGNVAQTLAFDRAQTQGGLSLLFHLATHLDEALAIARITATPRHLFERVYSSVVPFAHGPHRVVRYGLRVSPDQTLFAASPGPNQLREGLVRQLQQGDLKLDFCLQMRDVTADPIEDARMPWAGCLERIATLTLHAEGFGSPEQEALGEHMSFNPWNALEAHRPLGGLNRARRVVYRAVYELRSRLNGKLPQEPTAALAPPQHT